MKPLIIAVTVLLVVFGVMLTAQAQAPVCGVPNWIGATVVKPVDLTYGFGTELLVRVYTANAPYGTLPQIEITVRVCGYWRGEYLVQNAEMNTLFIWSEETLQSVIVR